MKLLLIHSDYIKYEAKQETPVAEDESEIEPEGRLDEALTAFIAVESGDSEDIDSVIEQAEDEIRDVADELEVENVMVYPYAHLSSDLGDPDTAVDVLRRIEERLVDVGYEVKRAPFGWYKAFEISCKGHPMSELSREIEPTEIEPEPEAEDNEEEEEEESDFVVLTPEGEEHDPVGFKSMSEASDEMVSLIEDEVEGIEAGAGEEPPHVETMKQKEYVDYDELSDPGNLRWYPKGKCVRDSLIEYVNDLVVDYGGMPVETPIMYDLGSDCISEHSEKFGERQYRFESGSRKMMLRFAACFGQFSIMRDMHITSNDLPLRIYEMSTYSFRREQRGELTGLKRLRAFTMPDMHTACGDIEEAQDEFAKQALLGFETGDDLGLDYVGVLRATREYYDEHRDWVEGLVDEIGEPVLVEIIPERKHYWSVKIDLAAIDSLGRPMENPTVQIDVESADRFDIEYYDENEEKEPILLHYSPTGSVERAFGAILENADGLETPRMPVWLSPTQVRFIPVGEEHTEYCESLADELDGVRVDIDDRDESVGKRIRTAEQDWVPYVAVVGDREIEGEEIEFRVRGDDETEMSVEELRDEIDEKIGEMPRKSLYTPRLLSNNPRFVG
ncbi:threonine--tRNA ligase [Halorutilales archaeon Cl-col2-1]